MIRLLTTALGRPIHKHCLSRGGFLFTSESTHGVCIVACGFLTDHQFYNNARLCRATHRWQHTISNGSVDTKPTQEKLGSKQTSSAATATETVMAPEATVGAAAVRAAPHRVAEQSRAKHFGVDRNFITALRAMNEYLLKPSDLDSLRKFYRRSPYENEPPIAVYLRRDVEQKALDVWGNETVLKRELRKRAELEQKYKKDVFEVKKVIKEHARKESIRQQVKANLQTSNRVVLAAVTINAANFTLKLLAWVYTGSHSLFSEAVHSLADTCNQLILAYGIRKSIQEADSSHPYGYSAMPYVASLVSGVGVFCLGMGLNVYHGVQGLVSPEPIGTLYWAYFILGGALVSEGGTLLLALNAIRKGAKEADMTFWQYVGAAQDPTVNVVLLEDIASVVGVGIAGVCMGLSSIMDSHIPDAIGCCIIGFLLGGVAMFIIQTSAGALVGRSIPSPRLERINTELENDIMIRAIHDAKCIDMGNAMVRYKAEIDFDGRELTREYLNKQDLEALLDEMKTMSSIVDVEQFMLKHGENVIDMVGAEIDRIERELKMKHPEVKHCDLELL